MMESLRQHFVFMKTVDFLEILMSDSISMHEETLKRLDYFERAID